MLSFLVWMKGKIVSSCHGSSSQDLARDPFRKPASLYAEKPKKEGEKEKEKLIFLIYKELTFTVMEAEKSHEQQLSNWKWRPRRKEDISFSVRLKAEAPRFSSKTIRQRERILPSPTVLFYAALNGLDEVHPRGGGPSALFSLLITMFISSRNTQTYSEWCEAEYTVTLWASHVDTQK